MARICFVSTYKPIMCGIADYTSFVVNASPPGRWGVVSFHPSQFGAPQVPPNGHMAERVAYTIPGRDRYSPNAILDGMSRLRLDGHDCVVWFQHEFGIWPNDERFANMLQDLRYPKVVTFHTLHFQSTETESGLRRREYEILQRVLPHVDAITVFSRGAHRAVTSAFPEHATKVYILNHGIHSYPGIASLSRPRAKYELYDYLAHRSDLDDALKKTLRRERIFVDPDVFMIGETGFLCPLKRSESLFEYKDALQPILREKRVIAVRIGSPRETSHVSYFCELTERPDHRSEYLLGLWLPPKILPIAQRAFDLNFYWPSDCTQSGILTHAVGTGAIVGGRNMEGTGELLRASGQIAENDLGHLLHRTRDLALNSEIARGIEEVTLAYANEFSWPKQAMRHYALARRVLAGANGVGPGAHRTSCHGSNLARPVLPSLSQRNAKTEAW